ncbi:alpha/beta fold hydrolase [Propionivibrio sp.]|uniref:alpha/beta fold hydrolase n=1 Tax=Propionivibrio sp. TaxID=2212460 RepID=UPI0025DC90F0|nr:alpha/beta fold hydrolase [Propionivibrio sp.]
MNTQNARHEPRERSVQCASPSGLHRMAYTEWGDPANPQVLVCVHGLSRNGHDFDDLSRAMAGSHRIVCPDIVGRGRSDWLRDPSGYGVPQHVADMMVLIARLDVEAVHWLGTSMGGLIGMVLASLPGTPVSRLLLNDVGPVVSAESIRRIGEYIGRAPKFSGLDDAERYIRAVSAPFGALNDAQWRALTVSSVRPMADGGLEMIYDPAIAESFHRATAGGVVDLWPMFDRVRCPTRVVRGELSDLLSTEVAQAMTARGPHPDLVEVSGVGHAPMFMDEAQIAIAREFFTAD